MSDRIGLLRGPSPAARGADARVALRVSTVSLASVAVLISLPGWLRSMEQASFPIPSLQPSTIIAHGAALVMTGPGDEVSPAARSVAQKQSATAETSLPRLLAESLAQRHRVSREAVERFVRLAYMAGQMTKVDPLLIVAVMAVESTFNPLAESVMGAKGLMQIIPQYHQDKLRTPQGGEANVLDPEVNIVAGAKVLKEYAARTGGDLPAALGLYGGVGPDPANSYTSRVMAEWQRLEQFVHRLRSGAVAPRPGQA